VTRPSVAPASSTHPELENLMNPHPSRRATRVIIALAAAIGLAAVGAGPAIAKVPAAAGIEGWVRVAHLSPDTKSVDIQLTALRGGETVFELDDVRYGMVSDYLTLPAGTYVVSMVPSDAGSDAKPIVSASVRIVDDKSVTVAALGENDDLQTRVFQDDLTGPASGEARIRLIQASTVTPAVDVQTSTGILIARDARAGSSTSYATVPAGPWDLELTGSGVDHSAAVQLPDGSVNTLFVLDNAQGGLTVMSVLDSASVGAAPVGGVQTGGGALARTDTGVDRTDFYAAQTVVR